MKRKVFLATILVMFLIGVNGCQKKNSIENSKFDAYIIGFNAEKCFCCWGWQIKIGNEIIKADSLPDISLVGYTINSQIPVEIETGEKKQVCSDGQNYYVIKSLTLK